ncbi:transmembrane protein 176B-like [Trematomus bernacchii]|uniref:transmembrane protein 176B-like n=1 Tax=Trematomus bernacchii TaxID=40690 RepID=UPI00146AEFA2|nr:transmembrane protein 176B-like [Trematomus bernacchii]
MALTISKTEGSIVITLTSDPQSVCPPLYQILKNLCCSPICCSVSQHLRRLQNTSQTVLGTLQIMVGLLNIGIGAIFAFSPYWDISGFPFWLGALFMLFGIVSILSEKYPSPCLVIVNVILNLAGVGFAIAAITLYSLRMTHMWLYWLCDNDNYDPYPYSHHSPTASSGEKRMEQECLETKDMMLMLLRSMHGLMIVLSTLELCLTISSAVLGIKALMRRGKDEKMNEEPEYYKPLLDEVPGNPEV